MRSLFSVGGRLLGIYFTYYGLSNLFSIVILLVSPSPDFPQVGKAAIIYSSISTIILLSISFLLIFYTEFLADISRLKDESVNYQAFPTKDALQAGVVLIGIYIFTTNIGEVISAIQKQILTKRMGEDLGATYPPSLNFTGDIVEPGVTIVFALFLIFGSKIFTKLVGRPDQ